MILSQHQLAHNIFWGVCKALKVLQMILHIILEQQQNLKMMSARLPGLSRRIPMGSLSSWHLEFCKFVFLYIFYFISNGLFSLCCRSIKIDLQISISAAWLLIFKVRPQKCFMFRSRRPSRPHELYLFNIHEAEFTVWYRCTFACEMFVYYITIARIQQVAASRACFSWSLTACGWAEDL